MRLIFDVIKHHFRIGYRLYLLIFDLFLVSFFIIDVIRSTSNSSVAIKNSMQHFPEFWTTILWFLLFNLLLFPFCIAFLRIALGSNRYLTDIWLGRKIRFTTISHILLSLLLAFLFLCSKALMDLEGPSLVNGSVEHAFRSFFFILIKDFISNFTSFIVIPIISGSYLVSLIVDRLSNNSNLIQEYILKARIIDLNSKYYPNQRRPLLNLNSGALFPEIKYVKNNADQIIEEYNQNIPGSYQASRVIQETTGNLKKLFKQIFLDQLMLKCELEIEFYPGTSRALEVAMSEIPHPREFMVSPFEHPTINKLIEKFCEETEESNYHPINFNPSDYYKNWQEQEKILVSEISKTVKKNQSINAIIISEVFYANGQIIPIESFFDRLSKRMDIDKLYILIDGSHALGNIENPSLNFDYNAYFASAHKWLLCPKPLGILIKCYEKDDSVETYDCWGRNNIPLTTSDIAPIAHFYGSLSLIKEITYDYMSFRTSALKKRLVLNLKNKFEIVGMTYDECINSESSILSIIPLRNKYVWYNKQSLEVDLIDNKIVANVIQELDHNLPWLRLTISYFLEIKDIDRLSKVLLSLLKENKS